MVSTEVRPPLHIMLVDDDMKRAAWVEKCLTETGIYTCTIVDDVLRMLKAVSAEQPDVIIIDMASPGRDILESLTILTRHQPTPVVMFSAEEDPVYISEAVEAGVSTYLVGSIDTDKVKPIIEIALAQFRSFQQLRSALDKTRIELSERRDIDNAKRILISNLNMTEPQAYEYMRNQAMACNMRIGQVAQRIVKLHDGEK